MKKIILGFSLSLISVLSVAGTGNGFNVLTTPNIVNLGRCHMDECSWSQTKNVKILSNTKTEELLEVELLGGSSPNSEGGSSTQGDQEITWNKETHKVIVYCSHDNPRLSLDRQMTYLDFKSGIPGVLESDARLYLESCHSFTGDSDEGAREFGYM